MSANTNTSFNRISDIKNAPERVSGIIAAFDGSRNAAVTFSNSSKSDVGHEKVSSMFAAATFFNGDFRGETARQNLNDFANQGGERISFN